MTATIPERPTGAPAPAPKPAPPRRNVKKLVIGAVIAIAVIIVLLVVVALSFFKSVGDTANKIDASSTPSATAPTTPGGTEPTGQEGNSPVLNPDDPDPALQLADQLKLGDQFWLNTEGYAHKKKAAPHSATGPNATRSQILSDINQAWLEPCASNAHDRSWLWSFVADPANNPFYINYGYGVTNNFKVRCLQFLEAQPAEPANTDQYGQAHLDTVYNGNQPGSTERGYYVALNTDGDGTTVTSASWTMQVIVKWELGHWLITDVTPVNGG